jgi:hypothetical protein
MSSLRVVWCPATQDIFCATLYLSSSTHFDTAGYVLGAPRFDGLQSSALGTFVTAVMSSKSLSIGDRKLQALSQRSRHLGAISSCSVHPLVTLDFR